MPLGTKVTIVGAGSLRAAAPVLASLVSFPLTPEHKVTLCDTDEEVLDLADRLARTLAVAQELDLVIVSTPDIAEAMAGADTVILTFGLGSQRDLVEGQSSEAAAIARGMLLRNSFERINDILFSANPAPRVFNLVLPTELSAQLLAYDAVHLDWPAALPVNDRVPVAHQILRWVRGDEPVFSLLRENNSSPLVEAIKSSQPGVNRFNPNAVKGWAADLEALSPGFGNRLMSQDWLI
jgi:hypothetical protein